jgi:hypothetical protein
MMIVRNHVSRLVKCKWLLALTTSHSNPACRSLCSFVRVEISRWSLDQRMPSIGSFNQHSPCVSHLLQVINFVILYGGFLEPITMLQQSQPAPPSIVLQVSLVEGLQIRVCWSVVANLCFVPWTFHYLGAKNVAHLRRPEPAS